MADIVLINPAFDVSFWGLETVLPMLGKSASMPPACLPLLAALTPEGHRVTLIDENVEPIDYDRCARADIVGVTGMSVQRQRMREILVELKRRQAFTVVGGPWASVQEDYFAGLADVVFVGEAEESWPRFLGEWASGEHQARYEQADKTDMTTVPVPRFDLLKTGRYAFGSVQFSRGCPFRCEFCDIIVTFGRKPRIKSSGQIIAELEVLRAKGLRFIFIVDDNLIGNKKAIKELLREVIAWQRRNGYPLLFSTQVSLDLAEDAELMRLMVEAGFILVFVGIVSPNEASLRETKKLQNVHKISAMADRVHAIQRSGMEVHCGMILGFDQDDASIFDAHHRFLDDARIATAMVGMLTAIPKTPLHNRLAREGRLDLADTPEHGTNVIPLQMTGEQLRQGYGKLMGDLYAPGSFFQRLDSLYIGQRIGIGRAHAEHWRQQRWLGLRTSALFLTAAAAIFVQLMRGVKDRVLRHEYRRRFWGLLKARREPIAIYSYAVACAMHYHFFTLTRELTGSRGQVVNTF